MVKSLLIEDIIYRNWEAYDNAKCYLIRGESCNICFDNINTSRDAYLSNCGHSFHHSCIYKYQYVKENTDHEDIMCPVCRQDPGAWNLDITKYWLYDTTTSLDKLDNFWIFLDINQPCLDSCHVCCKILIGKERFILNKCGHRTTCGLHQYQSCRNCLLDPKKTISR